MTVLQLHVDVGLRHLGGVGVSTVYPPVSLSVETSIVLVKLVVPFGVRRVSHTRHMES